MTQCTSSVPLALACMSVPATGANPGSRGLPAALPLRGKLEAPKGAAKMPDPKGRWRGETRRKGAHIRCSITMRALLCIARRRGTRCSVTVTGMTPAQARGHWRTERYDPARSRSSRMQRVISLIRDAYVYRKFAGNRMWFLFLITDSVQCAVGKRTEPCDRCMHAPDR